MITFQLIALYTLIPMSFAIVGGIIGLMYQPKPKTFSSLQHFTAGVIIASVSIELLPKILGSHSPWIIAEGFIVGIVLMLFLERFSRSLATKKTKKGEGEFPIGLIVGTSIDLLIDGILIGISFLSSQTGGILIAISLSFCAFFLTLTVSSTLYRRRGASKVSGLTDLKSAHIINTERLDVDQPRELDPSSNAENQPVSGIGEKKSILSIRLLTLFSIPLMLPVGVLLGWNIVAQFSPSALIGTIAFSVAALLYVGIEELLAEGHETKDTVWISASFFLGFLTILLFIS